MSVLPIPVTQTSSTGCRLVALDGRVLPLAGVRLDAEARAGLAAVVLRQTFRNVHAEPLTATYQLPLPADGAVTGFAFVIGDRRVVGEIDRKASARERFEQAVLEGRTAALLEQDRSNLFEQQIANIPPGAEIVAEITVEQPLAWKDGAWEWRFPTTVAPRFLGEPGKTPDAERVTVEVADQSTRIPASVALHVADTMTGSATSPSHPIHADGDALRLTGGLDRDVVVRWPVAVHQPGVDLEVGPGPEGLCGLLTLVPPLPETSVRAVPRDLILLIDTSGSMGGRPLDQARAFCEALVDRLGPDDQLEMIEFSSRPTRWRMAPERMNHTARADAIRWLRALRASGGTYMHEAIQEALRPLRGGAQRQVVLVTDGLIGFERDIIGAIRTRLPTTCRVHSIGVGSSVNRALLGPSARAGGGIECVVSLDEDPAPQVEQLLARTGQPLVVDLELGGSALVQLAPARLPDLFGACPTRISLRLQPGELVIRGRTVDGPWERRHVVEPVSVGRAVLGTRYARERVEDLEVATAAGDACDGEIETLGLTYRISTRLTSWVAISSKIDVDPTAPTRKETVPHELPHGMSAQGVGLRQAAMPNLALAAPPAPKRASGRARKKMARKPRPSPGGKRDDAPSKPLAPPPMPAMSQPMAGGAPPADEPEPVAEAEKATREELAEEARPSIVRGLVDRLFGAIFETDDEDDEGEATESILLRVKAVIRKLSGDELVVEFQAPLDFAWSAEGTVTATWADGTTLTLTVVNPTTRPGPVSRGQFVRLSAKLPAGRGKPVTIDVGGRVVLEL